MEDKAKTSVSQAELLKDFSPTEVASILSRSRSWVVKHRELFDVYPVPGRGRTSEELRFTRESVLAYRERLRAGANGNGSDAGKTAEQIISDVKARRALAGESL